MPMNTTTSEALADYEKAVRMAKEAAKHCRRLMIF